MGWFSSLLKTAAPIVGGALFGPAGAAVAGAATGYLTNRAQANDVARANAAGIQHANYLQGTPIGQTYLPAGGAAVAQMQGLLGIGGDPAAAEAAYQNYLGSIGFQHQLDTGSRAITGNRAARGLLGSGSTARALTEFGDNLARTNFSNYIAQLSGLAGQGLQAGGMLGQGAQTAAQIAAGGGADVAGIRARGRDEAIAGLGGLADSVGNWIKNRAGVGGGGSVVMSNVPDIIIPRGAA